MNKQKAHEYVTQKIIEQLEKADSSKWSQPWISAGSHGLHSSIGSGKPYKGINQFLLMMFSPYLDSRWGTYKAWQEKGAGVRKGEKGTKIILFKSVEKEVDGKTEKYMFSNLFTVFNAEQVDNAPAAPVVERPPSKLERTQAVEAWVKATGAEIRHGQHGAFYNPTADYVGMPDAESFIEKMGDDALVSYYGVLMHELTHWTGHRSRIDRLEKFSKFGSEAYAFEELIAELGAAFACAALGIEQSPRPDHAEYIASWLKVLRKDSMAVLSAAKQAQAAFEHLDAFQAAQEIAA